MVSTLASLPFPSRVQPEAALKTRVFGGQRGCPEALPGAGELFLPKLTAIFSGPANLFCFRSFANATSASYKRHGL